MFPFKKSDNVGVSHDALKTTARNIQRKVFSKT